MGWIMGLSPELKKCPPDTFSPPQGAVALFESHSPGYNKSTPDGVLLLYGKGMVS